MHTNEKPLDITLCSACDEYCVGTKYQSEMQTMFSLKFIEVISTNILETSILPISNIDVHKPDHERSMLELCNNMTNDVR